MDALDRNQRLQLMKFVCSFAWADLEIHPDERIHIAGLIRRLKLDADEAAQVEAWLALPPRPESVDPTQISVEHRRLFIESMRGIIAADGEISREEEENLALLEMLLV